MNQKLKALELHGYKTFASKTLFEFPDKITAVVGPNGSGKSNIADSIRWVLGEQAYSLLRGKKTEDMIYSGSAQRSKMSMASATIHFDNESNWLPIEFDDVSITRRAYRSGENEYLINDKKVRLRDIQDLLANSGLAERTYTIIGQGLVDSALSLKPQDRRLFFEEAAGIRLYRSRREEAIRKLDKTLDNMARVKDILHEIRPRIRRLEKQVEKSIEYNRVTADLNLLLKDWYGYRWNKLQRDYRAAMEAKLQKEAELNRIRREVTDGDEALEEKRKGLFEKRDILSGWNEQLSILQKEREQINRDLAIIEERFKGYEEQRDSLRSSLAYAEEELKSRQEQASEHEKQHQEQAQALEKCKHELDLLKITLDEKRAELQKVRDQIATLQNNKLELEKKLAGDQAKISDLESRTEILIKRRTDLEESIHTQEEALSEIDDELSQFQDFFNEKQKGLDDANEALRQINEEKAHLEDEVKKVQQNLHNKQNERSANETKLEVLMTAKKNLEGFKTGTKKILNAFQQKKMHGTYELLLSCMRVENGYEKAVAAILGDTAEGLVLDESMQLEGILNLIRSADESHSILIPQALIKRGKNGSGHCPEGCRSMLEVVHASSQFEPVLQILFSDAFVLEDKQLLEKALTQLEKHQKIVLADGGIFYENGIISVGGTTSEFIFKREKEIDILKENIQKLVRDSEKLQKEKQHLQDDLGKINEKTTDLKTRIGTIEKELKTIHNGLRDVEKKKTDAVQDIRLNKELIAKLLSDIEETLKNKGTLKTAIEETKQKALETQKAVEGLKEKAETYSLEELNQDFYQKQTDYAVTQESYVSSQTRLKETNALLERLTIQVDEYKEKIRVLQKNHTSLQEKYDQNSVRSQELAGQIKELSETIHPVEQEVRNINEVIEETQTNSEKLRKDQSIIERHFIQLEMRVDKIKTQMEALKERISDDFGLVSYEYEPEITGPKPLPIDGMVNSLPKIMEVPDDLESQIKSLKSSIRRMGSVNPEAEKEFKEEKERFDFLTSQIEDLEKAEKDLRKIVLELEEIIKVNFKATFKAVNEQFSDIFKQLFGGGSAKLVIVDEENITDTGIEIEATLPGKRKQELALLSGGERSLTAIALIFSLLRISPTPFCVLDEVDAMLDEANVVRLGQLMKELSDRTQFIVITHNRNTVQLANVIYGVTMGRDSASQLISLKLEELTDEMVE